MKLAEALQHRADINTRIQELKTRIASNVLVQEGEQSPEDATELIAEASRLTDELHRIMRQINLTNATATVNGRTLTDIIAEKDALTVKRSVYMDAVRAASVNVSRYSRNEIKILPTIDVKKIQKEVDDLAKQIRLLDNTLQENNWKTDLMED